MTHLTLLLASVGAVAVVSQEACTDTACEDAASEPDTSLLQHRLQVEQAPSVYVDVPEASWGWALWQNIDEVSDPYQLANTTTLPLPGAVHSLQPALIKALALAGGKGFNAPTGVTDDSEQWIVDCLGRDYLVTPVSSWTLAYVSMPQLVPFVVPMDQEGRSDVSIIIAPGGGGLVLDWEIEGTDIAKAFNRLGISAFVLKYRIPLTQWGQVPEIMDSQRALGLVRHFAPTFGLNASRVGMFGASHGGVTCTYSSFTKRLYPRRDAIDDLRLKPDFWILVYPELHIDTFAKAAVQPTKDQWGIEIEGLDNAPPTFIAAGENDHCCPVETMYLFHELLKAHTKVPVEVNVFSDVGHFWATCFRRGIEVMMHEACLWMLRARHFIMWNVEHKVPSEIDAVYQETIKYINPLLVRNVSG